MRNRIFGGLSFVGAALWTLSWEFVRSLFYERGSHMLTPFINSITMDQIVHWGPPIGLSFVGGWLFWTTRAKGNATTVKTELNPPLVGVFEHTPTGQPPIAKSEVNRAAILSNLRNRYPNRIIVDVAPKFLMNLYKDKLTHEGDRAIAPYIGNWLLLSGPLDDVSGPTAMFGTNVTFERKIGEPFIEMYFDEMWIRRLHVLAPKQNIVALCQLRNAGSVTAFFHHCEVIDQDSGLPFSVPYRLNILQADPFQLQRR
jgi:hypothetical protein